VEFNLTNAPPKTSCLRELRIHRSSVRPG
jgi:hypothetical protein